jgi:hypothetical protein
MSEQLGKSLEVSRALGTRSTAGASSLDAVATKTVATECLV